MYQIKGTSLVTLIDIAKKHKVLDEWMGKMSGDEKAMYKQVLAFKWYPLIMDNENNSFVILANILFPGDKLAIRKLGKLQIKMKIKGIYKLFIRIPSPDAVLSKSIQMWKVTHDTGDFTTRKTGTDEVEVTIREYEKMPAYIRQVIWGTLEGIGELVNKTFEVALDESDPSCWKYTVKFKA